MIRLGALAIVLAAAPIRAQETYPALFGVTGVSADDVLNIRAAPSATAPIIGSLAPRATGIEVIAVQDGWATVSAGEASGFVSTRYLARVPGPDWFALTAPLHCLGTEPFWSLTFDPVAGTTSFATPDAPGRSVAPLGQTWPGQIWSPAAALALGDGMAVLHPAACSDGMSERTYGITADIFLTGPDRPRLSGCCTVSND